MASLLRSNLVPFWSADKSIFTTLIAPLKLIDIWQKWGNRKQSYSCIQCRIFKNETPKLFSFLKVTLKEDRIGGNPKKFNAQAKHKKMSMKLFSTCLFKAYFSRRTEVWINLYHFSLIEFYRFFSCNFDDMIRSWICYYGTQTRYRGKSVAEVDLRGQQFTCHWLYMESIALW